MNHRNAKSAAFAGMVQQINQNRAATFAAEARAVATATDEQREMKTGDLFKEAFVPCTEPRRYDRQEVPQERPWDAALRLGADDDAPRPPEPAAAAPEPAAASSMPEPPVQETRVRAEDLFASIEARMQPTIEVANLPPDAQLRRAFRELPGSVREKIAATVEAQDFGLPGYFAGRGFGQDYVSVLVGSALARRFADAQRLQPDLTPAELLQQISEAA